MNSNPNADNIRVSDVERSSTISALSQFYAEGRLTVDEYDERCALATTAKTQAELNALFTDLPPVPEMQHGSSVEPFYSAAEIDQAHDQGKRPKLAVLSLATIGSVAGTIALSALGMELAALLVLFIIPVVAIMLYVAKVGPASWHRPSQQQLHRERIRELRSAEKLRAAELRVQRKERQAELTTKAMDWAGDAIKKRRGK